MKTTEVTIVRLYLTEGDRQLEHYLSLLHDQEQVWGVTAFRGIAGFGKSGRMHSSTLIDISLNLPLVIEFFDRPEKVAQVLSDLKNELEPGHVLTWTAHVNNGE
jgi:PII-like signaling protein